MPADKRPHFKIWLSILIHRFGSDILLLTQVNKVPDKLFLLDTGSWDNTITPAAAREVGKVHAD
jgi:hypothetical protein